MPEKFHRLPLTKLFSPFNREVMHPADTKIVTFAKGDKSIQGVMVNGEISIAIPLTVSYIHSEEFDVDTKKSIAELNKISVHNFDQLKDSERTWLTEKASEFLGYAQNTCIDGIYFDGANMSDREAGHLYPYNSGDISNQDEFIAKLDSILGPKGITITIS